MPGYEDRHAKSGIKTPLPPIESFPSQYPKYTVTIETPEYNAICPKTGLPDFGTLTVTYEPARLVVELKSFKEYLTAYRHVGIFYENAANRILADIVKAVKPRWCRVVLKTGPRGGIHSVIEAVQGRVPPVHPFK